MTISVEPIRAKPADSGHLHACVTIGVDDFTPTDQAEIRDFAIGELRCWRAANGISSGCGVFVIGDVTGGRIGLLVDHGSPRLHSGLLQCHWTAKNTLGGYGFQSGLVYPIGGLTIGRVKAERSAAA